MELISEDLGFGANCPHTSTHVIEFYGAPCQIHSQRGANSVLVKHAKTNGVITKKKLESDEPLTGKKRKEKKNLPPWLRREDTMGRSSRCGGVGVPSDGCVLHGGAEKALEHPCLRPNGDTGPCGGPRPQW